MGKYIFTIREAQIYLDLSISQIYKLTSTNRISFYKTGKRIYFKMEQLDQYLTQNYIKSGY
ncbi:MAG: helix-turn-helix domain-containing protein [Labilibaculum sp.]|nr:helix-turn-helix domain-containing protein [Labilibaculum sp.]